ncbi:MAG: hypothetical protein WC047_05205 [Kiritimatiellales bacterium]
MTTAETKAAWKSARAELDSIEDERRNLVAATEIRYQMALAKLQDAEDETGECVAHCECGEPIFEGEPYHNGRDVALCASCAPSYGDMLASPRNFLAWGDEEDCEMTKEQAQAIVDAHIAAGGSLDDKMVQS